MEITILLIELFASTGLILLMFAQRLRLWGVLSTFVSLITLMEMMTSANAVSYVSNGTLVNVDAGGFFIFILVVLIIVAVLGIYQNS